MKYWTETETEELINIYENHKDEKGNFLAFKVKKKDLVKGRSINSHSSKLTRDYDVKVIGSKSAVAHRLDYKGIYEASMNGCTTRQLAKDFNTSHQSIRVAIDKYIKENNLTKTPPKAHWSKEEDKALLSIVNANTRYDGCVNWKSAAVPLELQNRTYISLVKRWTKNLKADYVWNGEFWEEEKAKGGMQLNTEKVKTTRRSFLWGAYTFETKGF